MKAVILTAGEGTRMRPLTYKKPKTMLQVGGKPIIQYNIEALKRAGIKDILMVVGYKKSSIKAHFKNGIKHGVNITYINQKEQLGTAHAIGTLKEITNEPFIVLNGDIIINSLLIKDLIDKYGANKPSSILTLTQVENPSQYGAVEVKGDRVQNIFEKPDFEEVTSNLINAGIYLFDIDIFDAINKTVKSVRGEYEITDSIKIQIKENKTVIGVKSEHKWIDIGRPWDLLNINQHFLSKTKNEIHGEIEEGVTIHGPLFLGHNSIIRSGTYIQGPVFVGKGCDIGPNSYLRKYTSIGDNVKVGNAVEIKNSIIMDKTNVNHLSYVGDSIISSNCNIAAGTNIANLRFDEENIKISIKGEKIDCGKRKFGVVFGEGVKTGINSSFNPGIKVGVSSSIGAGVTIYDDVPSYSLILVKQPHKIINLRKD
jgi:UDP-N-acetylglucosamine diphosphorylase / glucose-1-phosphate thymidylyltransferase / UDP-N-acetylgalactosamine diphosphorylase / glucosamine-1-phosphate N-acetyltransferase / galactosamine-1-phosphate N-acetyltransferase